MEKAGFAVCFTGHRPKKLPFAESSPAFFALSERVYAELLSLCGEGANTLYFGMAEGCDLMFGECAVRLRNVFPHVKLIAAIPFRGQAAKFSAGSRARYRALLDAADECVLAGGDPGRGCMRRRNEYMVDRSERVLAVFDGSPGGTAYTVAYAKRQGKAVTVIDPRLFCSPRL